MFGQMEERIAVGPVLGQVASYIVGISTLASCEAA